MRSRLTACAAAVLALLVASEASAASRRATVLLIPVDRNSGSAAMRYTEFLEAAVSKRANYTLKDAASILGDTTPTSALEARKRVIAAVGEAKKKYVEGTYDEAESTLRTALIDIDNAAAAMERCGEYCDALAYLAGAQLMKGDETAARDVLKGLLAIDKGYKFDAATFGKNMMVLVKDVLKKQIEEGGLVSITVQTLPAGGRIFLDGALKGYAPITIERVPAGKHLLRVERGGSITYGQLVETATDEVTVKAKLTSTPEYAALEGSLDKVADEIERGESSAEMMKLGSKLKVDRAIVGLVRTTETKVALECVLLDFAGKKKLARSSRAFQGDEYGELEKEVQRFGNLLLAEGDGLKEKVKKSSDPLDNTSGLEEWEEESSGGSSNPDSDKPKEKPKDKKKQKTDLDGETGTNDW